MHSSPPPSTPTSTLYLFSLTFATIEASLATSISLTSRLFPNGSTLVGILYTTFALSALIVPSLQQRINNTQYLLLYAQTSAVFCIAACALSLTFSNKNSQLFTTIILYASSVLAGVSSAIIWACGSTLISTKYLNLNNGADYVQGVFNSVIFIVTLFMHAFSGVVLEVFEGAGGGEGVMFGCLLLFDLVAVCVHWKLIRLSMASSSSSSSPDSLQSTNSIITSNDETKASNPIIFLLPSIQSTLSTTLSSPLLSTLLPLHVIFGLTESLILSTVSVNLVEETAFVGYGTAVKTAVGAVSARFIFGWILSVDEKVLEIERKKDRPVISKGRHTSVLLGLTTYVLLNYLILFSTLTKSTTLTLLTIYALNGLASAMWSTTASGSIITNYISDHKLTVNETTMIFASVKLVSGGASAFGFLVYPLLSVVGAVGVNCCVVAVGSLWYLWNVYLRGVKVGGEVNDYEKESEGESVIIRVFKHLRKLLQIRVGRKEDKVGLDLLDDFDQVELTDLEFEEL